MTTTLTDLSAKDLTLLKSALLSYKNCIQCEQGSPREGEVDNCANNSIESLDVQICPDAEVDISLGGMIGFVYGELVRYD